ncbi:AEC family transporter [[Mycoplasma] anseris]|uniref:Malate permease n=1 Tax=[Mycoplasma] anseris TaxID=92400 RepID=A0A2Z4NDA0_9BACT|nr:AEC family transporter [[Mycoplasma] anseris]AWX69564.1 malate permease [[Mycoplasma] anseris]
MNKNLAVLFQEIITNTGLWGAIIATFVITFLGYFLYKFKVLNDNSTQSLQKIIINVLLPFLAFFSFLRNAEKTDLKTLAIVFGLSAIYYILLTSIALIMVKFLPKLVPKHVINRAEKDFLEVQQKLEFNNQMVFNKNEYLEQLQKKHLVTWLMCIYGSNIIFATPIVLGVFPNGIQLSALNVWNILYYIGGFGLAFSLISGVKFNKKEFKLTILKTVKNSSFIAVIIAIAFWLTQYIPKAGGSNIELQEVQRAILTLPDGATKELGFTHIASFGPNFKTLYGFKNHGVFEWYLPIKQATETQLMEVIRYQGNPTGWFDWNVTMPYLYKFISMLALMVSPLIWMVIGTSLAKTNIKEMFAKKDNWLFIFLKMIIMPLVIMAMVIPFVATKLLPPSIGAVLVMTGSVPPGTTVVIYSQHFKTHDRYTSQVSSLSTIFSFIFIPIWLVIGTIVMNSV